MTKMKEFKFLGLALMLVGLVNAQDANDAKKSIDAEQYQKAKTTLKSLISSSPDEGKNYFLLGEVYLTQTVEDSAALYFNKGVSAKNNAEFNNIGLGHLDLNNGNAAAAQAKFDAVEKGLKKKDVEQLVYIGRAYTYADTPDYTKAVAVLNKAIAKDAKYAPAYLALGEAYYRSKDHNNAYKNFRTASELDPSLLRAQLQLGVITKNTGAAFPEAVKFFEGIVAKNANYGPVYRELAETYYKWGNTDFAKKKEYNAKALENYRKYMSLTDYSLDSRMRYADFLLLTGDYKALEAEANTMQQMDKVNPRILRYLAYSSYENGNFEGSLKAMKEFIAKVDPKRVIARDYLYLGLAQLATTVGKDDKDNSIIKDQVVFDEAIANIRKAAEMDIYITNEFNDIGKKLFAGKLYGPASIVFGVAITNPDSRNLLYDNFYYAYSVYYDYVSKTPEAQKSYVEQLKKADVALAKVIEIAPTSQDAYLYKAKVNQAIASSESYAEMAKNYDKYIEVVNTAGAAEVTKQSKNLLDAYSNAGAYYAVTDKPKAKDYFTKALAIDPADTYVKGELAKLK